jgi:DNA-binding SARP family transcriptional activator/tetratricopeptide (TPR) repeat protein
MPFIAKSAAPRESNSAAAHWTFDTAAAGGLTLFTAPPGYLLAEGLSDALRRQGRQTLWIRLGPEDRDPGTLLLSLLAAVQNQRPGFGLATLELMRRRPGPVAGWPPLFGRFAAELAEAMPRPAALVFEHAHHLGRAHLTLGLLGSTLLPALNADTACVLMSHEDLPPAALPANVVRRSTHDLRLSAALVHELLQRNAPGLGRRSALRAAALCRGGAATLAGVWGASALLGAAVVERAVHRARRAQDLLAALASAWLQMVGNEARCIVGLTLRLEYSHPTLTGAVLGETLLPPGPWLQSLVGDWSRVRTVWRDPLWSVLAPSRVPGLDVLHRAAEYLLNRGAAEQAIPLYLELRDATCAGRALAGEADRLVDLGQWDTLGDWLARLPPGTLGVEPRLLHNQAELAAANGRVEDAERGFSAAASLFAARSDPDRACGSMIAESVLAARRKDLARAQARARAASALADASGLENKQVWASWQLGCVAMAAEDLDSALAHFSRAAAVASRIGESAMSDLVLEAERLSTHLLQLQRQRKRHWEAWTFLQHTEREASTRVIEHLCGGLNRAGGLLDAYGWSGTPLAFKVPNPDPPVPAGTALDPAPWRRRLRPSTLTRRQTAAPASRPPERPATADHLLSLPARRSAEPGPTPELQPAAPLLTVHLLGQFWVSLNDVAVADWPSRRAQELFKYLITHRHHWLGREQVMEVFWPGSPPEAARNSLNVAIHGLRRALRASADVPVVVLEAGAYRLDSGLGLWIDVDEFEQHVEAGHRLEVAGELTAAVTEYELATALYQGDFLADDPYEEWPVLTRERLRVVYLDALDRLSHLYFTQRQYGSCATLCQVIVQRDPCREDAHRRLMRCFSRQGQIHLALRQYQVCVDALQAELAIDPDPSTVALRDQIRSHQIV